MADEKYLWENFVHFSSAKERVDNFVYKVQLIELYESAITKATTDYTSGSGAYYTGSLASIKEAEWQTSKKDELVNGFDGFEKYLYNENTNTTNTAASATWPYNGGVRMSSTSSVVLNWYENVSTSAEEYDKENTNYVLNNIPSFILRNSENENFLLFLCLIGQHFDNIYFHTEAIDRTRKLGYDSKDNIANKLLYHVLKSLGWDSKNMSADMTLLEYVLGQDANGTVKEDTPAKQRTYEIWRRILNNLPYLLKHKGSRRAIEGLLACYGIPSSILSVIEFGGPNTNNGSTSGGTTTTNDGTKDNTNTSNTNTFEYTTTSTAIHLTNSASVDVQWSYTNENDYPRSVEIFTQPSTAGQYTLISASQWSVQLSGSTDSKFGKVIFKSGSSNIITSSLVPIFNGSYFGVLLNKVTGSTTNTFQLNVAQVDTGRIIYSSSATASVSTAAATFWNSGSKISIGGGTYNYSGSVDEFRLWSTPLNTSRFVEHVSFPEMINGNHISASTEDLHLRLDFEYPKDLSTKTTLINVDPNIYFSGSLTRNQLEETVIPIKNVNILSDNISASFSASLRNFPSVGAYPYNFVPIERKVSLKTPDLGVTRYANNKVRFQEKPLNANLSATEKVTDSASDISPIDSNRVGIFFSPTKELNIDIAKSFGGENLDNYIGNPSDSYKESYKDLANLRSYYFKRFDRKDIYEYINLVKKYEKSVFDTVKKLMPAKAKVTTGILIEPHILERSKVKKKKPTGDNYQNEGQVSTTDHILVESENYQLETILPKVTEFDIISEDYQLESSIEDIINQTYDAESYQLDTLIENNTLYTAVAESYQNDSIIDVKYNDATISSIVEFLGTRVGQSTLEELGFGLYCQNGYAIRTYYDINGKLAKQRVLVNLITEQTTFDTYKFATVINGKGDPRGGYILTSSVLTNNILNIQPYTGSNGSVSTAPTVTGNIIRVEAVNGYLRTHFKYTSDLSAGLNASFYKGCKNTDATTIDGYPVVQTFTTNPNTLVVSKAGRPASEPILEVE